MKRPSTGYSKEYYSKLANEQNPSKGMYNTPECEKFIDDSCISKNKNRMDLTSDEFRSILIAYDKHIQSK